MVPSTVDGIVVLLLLIVPGLHYDLLRERYRPGRNESAFFEISRVLLSGVLLSSASLCILGLARWIAPPIIDDYSDLLIHPTYISAHLALTLWSTSWFLIVSLTIGSLVANSWPTDTAFVSSSESAWIIAFARTPQKKAAEQGFGPPQIEVEVKTKDGMVYEGVVSDYSKDPAIADRELILVPTSVTRADGSSISLQDQGWYQVVLSACEISSILVRYRATKFAISGGQHPNTGAELASLKSRKLNSFLGKMARSVYVKRNDVNWLTNLLVAEVILLFFCAFLEFLL